MELETKNRARIHQSADQDRLSDLMDDIILSILGRLDIFTAARTCVLSKRWRHLPWLLPELKFDVKDFLCAPCPDPVDTQHMDQAMESLTKATRSFLVNSHSKYTVTRLSLKLYVTDNHWHDIGPLFNDIVEGRMVRELDLAIIDEKEPPDCEDEDMRQQARNVTGIFSTCPSMLHYLTNLYLTNVRFAEWDMHHLLFDCCKQLQHLTLHNCDNGDRLLWLINAPNSKLKVLDIYASHFRRLDVLCLPNLERIHLDTWFYDGVPLRFGSIPSLEKLLLLSAAPKDHQAFSLSKLLHGTTNIHTLTLNFQGEKLWIRPEVKQLWSTFRNLRKLNIHGINVEFSLRWTIVLLEAAPSIEMLSVEMWEHPCSINEASILTFGEQPQKPLWKIPRLTHSNTWQLKELELFGFRPLRRQIYFLRAMMKQALNLRTILLKDTEPCKDCEAMDNRPPPLGGIFPRNKDEQETIVRQLRFRISSFAKIIFGS